MNAHPFLWEKLPDEVKAEAERLATLHERRVQISSDKLRNRLLMAASHTMGDPVAAMHDVLEERQMELERWQEKLREEREKQS